MELAPALVGALVGLLGGALVPLLIRLCPDPPVNPDEDPDDFPDHVPFAQLAARSGLRWKTMVACGLAGAVIAGLIGWSWGLPWLLFLVPVSCALAVIDYVTWYLPSRLIWPSYGIVAVLEIVAAVVLEDANVVIFAAIGFAALGAYYGLIWFLSPGIMAFGDVRYGALLGLGLGPLGVPVLFVSVLAAATLSVLAMIPLRVGGVMIRRKMPYGPFLAVGALVAVVVGQVLGRL